MIHEVQAFVLECDARGCQREWMGGADETVEETRYEASRAGWVADGGDLCPEHAHLEEKAADCGVSGCRACAAMRDRAKAKAAEHVVEHMRPLMVSEAGRTLMAKAAEPSAPAAGTPGTGAPAPKCDPDPPRDSHWDRPFMVEVCPHGCSEPSDCDICTPELLDHPRAEVFSEGPPTRSLADILRDPPKLNLSPPRECEPVAQVVTEMESLSPADVARAVYPPREVAPDRTQAKPHDSNCRAVRTGRSDTCNCVGKDARIYPCKECGDMRSMAEGGTTFTVCDACWGKTYEGGQQ